MGFFAPENFFFFWAIPAVIFLFWLSQQIWKKRLSRIGSFQTIRQKLLPNYKNSENMVRAILLCVALAFAIMALGRPQWGEEKRKIQRKGVDIIFMLDTSLSMLAEDIKPSRFEKAKIEIRNILRRLKGDRIGMVAFAGSGFLQSPLTLDYSAFLLFLDAIKVGYIPDAGTSLDRAIRLAINSFPEKENKHRAVIIFTDGEDHEGGLDTALEEAKAAGLRIYTIGTGSAQGEPIPLRDENRRRTGFKKDRAGEVVITKLNQTILELIAKETGAIYLPSTPGEDEIDILMRHMQSLGKREYKEKTIAEREDHFQLFLFLAFLFLILEMLLSRTFKIKKAALPLVVFFLVSQSSVYAADPEKLYKEKKYQSAMDVYRKEKTKNPDDPELRYNLGTTLYQLDQFSEASKELEKSAEAIKDPKIKAQALYNLGNTQYRLGQFEQAIESYKQSLELNPEDKDAKYNLELLTQKKGQFEKNNSERQKQSQNQQQNKQNQQNQQNQQQQQNQQNQQNQQQNQQNQQQNQQNQQQNQQNQQQNQQNQQQNQQDQQSQGQQDQKQDQQSQGQQDQPQDQQNQGGQGQEDKQDPQQKDPQDKQDQQKQGGQGQQEQEKQDQQQGQDQKDQQQKEQEKQDQQDQNGQKQDKPQSQPQDQQGQQPQAAKEPGQEQEQPSQPQPGGRQGRQPLQGQMSLENALQVLDALKEGEKELQDLRRPNQQGGEPRQPLKDW